MTRKPERSRRRRGVILSLQGWQRLQKAQQQSEIERNSGNPYTLEQLNELTSLSPKTLMKVRSRKVVDRQTLADFFSAFHLTLSPNDFTRAELETQASAPSPSLSPPKQDWGADFAKSIFAKTFGSVLSLEFSPDNALLATGNSNGELWLWQVDDGQLHLNFQGHTNWVWSLAWSPNGRILASGGADLNCKGVGRSHWTVPTNVRP